MSLCGYNFPTGSSCCAVAVRNQLDHQHLYVWPRLLIFVGVLIVSLLYQLDKKYPAIMKELAGAKMRGEL